MTNEFRQGKEPQKPEREILTFKPVIPEGREHDYKPPVRNVPQFKEDLRESKTVGIALMYSIFHSSSKMFR